MIWYVDDRSGAMETISWAHPRKREINALVRDVNHLSHPSPQTLLSLVHFKGFSGVFNACETKFDALVFRTMEAFSFNI